MGNRDHIQRANADKESCNNCIWNKSKFSQFPCVVCKGTNDMFWLDPNVPAVTTGKDLGYGKYTGKQISTLREIRKAITINPSGVSILCPGAYNNDTKTVDCSICLDMFPELDTSVDCPCNSGRSLWELLNGIDSILDETVYNCPQ